MTWDRFITATLGQSRTKSEMNKCVLLWSVCSMLA